VNDNARTIARKSRNRVTAELSIAPRGRRGEPRTHKRPTRQKGLLERIRERESLAGADLRRLWLSYWDLSKLDLCGAYLRGTYLVGSDLSGCDLRGANLEAANLSNACLRGAILEKANLLDAIVDSADFRGASGLSTGTLQALRSRGAIV